MTKLAIIPVTVIIQTAFLKMTFRYVTQGCAKWKDDGHFLTTPTWPLTPAIHCVAHRGQTQSSLRLLTRCGYILSQLDAARVAADSSSPCGCPAISHCCFRTSPCPWAVVPPSLSPQVQLSLGLLLLGVGIATVTDLQLNALGSIISLLAIISTCVAQIVSRG